MSEEKKTEEKKIDKLLVAVSIIPPQQPTENEAGDFTFELNYVSTGFKNRRSVCTKEVMRKVVNGKLFMKARKRWFIRVDDNDVVTGLYEAPNEDERKYDMSSDPSLKIQFSGKHAVVVGTRPKGLSEAKEVSIILAAERGLKEGTTVGDCYVNTATGEGDSRTYVLDAKLLINASKKDTDSGTIDYGV